MISTLARRSARGYRPPIQINGIGSPVCPLAREAALRGDSREREHELPYLFSGSYSPVKWVGRFSRNARTPSAKSLLLDNSP